MSKKNLATLDEIGQALIDLSVDGWMPSHIQWAIGKPDGMPSATTVSNRFGKRWCGVAEILGLRPRRNHDSSAGDQLQLSHLRAKRQEEMNRIGVKPAPKKKTEPVFNNPDFLIDTSRMTEGLR